MDEENALELLARGELDVEGRLIDASNATLFCNVSAAGQVARCVYKPVRGERPLWDFPDGTLAGREYAAFRLSQITGWALVPPTVLRDGPFGEGMVQLWIDVDEGVDLATLIRTDLPQLRRMAVFDAVVNNADRKGGHLLPTIAGHIYGCDHGLTFHVEDKLRTVLWGWRGSAFNDEEREALERIESGLSAGGTLAAALAGHLTRREVARAAVRVRRLLAGGTFPVPSGEWPAVPWPPF